MLKNDDWIIRKINEGMLTGASTKLVSKGVLSYGVSSYGYDVTLGDKVRIMKAGHVIDPKYPDESQWEEHTGVSVIIPPHGFALGYSNEYFKLPRDVSGIVFPKSTYARCGLNCLQTVLEASWEGQITLEFANLTPNPVRLYLGEGCAQVLFLGGEPCVRSYADRCGKYQGQMGVTLAKVI